MFKKKNNGIILGEEKIEKKFNIFKSEKLKPCYLNDYFNRWYPVNLIMPQKKSIEKTLKLIENDISNLNLGVVVVSPTNELTDKCLNIIEKTGRNYVYFNPLDVNSPYFNIFESDCEEYICHFILEMLIENLEIKEIYKGYEYKQNTDLKLLLKNSIKLIKSLYGTNASFLTLKDLLNKNFEMLIDYEKKICKDEIIDYFEKYFNNENNLHNDTIKVRMLLDEICNDKYLKNVLIPSKEKQKLKIEECINDKTILLINTANNELKNNSFILNSCISYELDNGILGRLYIKNGNWHNECFYFYQYENFIHSGSLWFVRCREYSHYNSSAIFISTKEYNNSFLEKHKSYLKAVYDEIFQFVLYEKIDLNYYENIIELNEPEWRNSNVKKIKKLSSLKNIEIPFDNYCFTLKYKDYKLLKLNNNED